MIKRSLRKAKSLDSPFAKLTGHPQKPTEDKKRDGHGLCEWQSQGTRQCSDQTSHSPERKKYFCRNKKTFKFNINFQMSIHMISTLGFLELYHCGKKRKKSLNWTNKRQTNRRYEGKKKGGGVHL